MLPHSISTVSEAVTHAGVAEQVQHWTCHSRALNTIQALSNCRSACKAHSQQPCCTCTCSKTLNQPSHCPPVQLYVEAQHAPQRRRSSHCCRLGPRHPSQAPRPVKHHQLGHKLIWDSHECALAGSNQGPHYFDAFHGATDWLCSQQRSHKAHLVADDKGPSQKYVDACTAQQASAQAELCQRSSPTFAEEQGF